MLFRSKTNSFKFGKFVYSGALCGGENSNDEAHMGKNGGKVHGCGDREHGNRSCDRRGSEYQLPRGGGGGDAIVARVLTVCAYRRSAGQRAELIHDLWRKINK